MRAEAASALVTSSPAISVLMPVHNAGRFLAPALDSVVAQTFSDFELIAIDDGSSDGSGTVLAEFAARDPRIRVFSQENQGIVATLNRALALARAPLIARMDADDVARLDRFARQAAHLREHPEVAVLSGAMDVIDDGGTCLRTDVFPTSPSVIEQELLQRCCVCHPAVMGRTEVLRSVGAYRKNAQYAEDYDLWLRISEVGQIANLPDVLVSYRVHTGRISAQRIVAQELAKLAALCAAMARRGGKPDFLARTDASLPAGYRATQRLVADAMPRAQFALSFFRAVLGRATEFGSIAEWSKLYLRHGLGDLDAEGAVLMILLLGHNMLRRRRGGAPLHALLPYVLWAAVTAVRHPIGALRIALNTRYWLALARARMLQSTSFVL